MNESEAVKKQSSDATAISPEEKLQILKTAVNVLAIICLIKSSETAGTIVNNIAQDITGRTETQKIPEFKSYTNLINCSTELIPDNRNNDLSILSAMSPRNESFDPLSILYNLYPTNPEDNLIQYPNIINIILKNTTQDARKTSENLIRVRRMNFIESSSAKLASEPFLTECRSIRNNYLYYNNNLGSTELYSKGLFKAKTLENYRDRFSTNNMPEICSNWTNNNSYQMRNISAKQIFFSNSKKKREVLLTDQTLIYSEPFSLSTIFDSILTETEVNQVMTYGTTAKSLYNFLFQVEYFTTNRNTKQSQSNNIMISPSDKCNRNKTDFKHFFTIDNLFEKNYVDLNRIDAVMQNTTLSLQGYRNKNNQVKNTGTDKNITNNKWLDIMNNEYFDNFIDFGDQYQDMPVTKMEFHIVTDTYFNVKNNRDNIYRHYDTFINCSNLADNFLLLRFYTTEDSCKTTPTTTANSTSSFKTSSTTTFKTSDYIIEEKFFSYDVVFATIILGLGMLLITTAICCCCINLMLS